MNLPALKMNSQLIRSAHLHNIAMLEVDTLSHQLPEEADLGKRISAQGVSWRMVAENIGYGRDDPKQAALDLNRSMFAEQPPNDGHRRNILSDAKSHNHVRRWQDALLLEEEPATGMLSLTGSGSWFVGNMLSELADEAPASEGW